MTQTGPGYEFDFSMDSILDIFKRMLAEMVAAILMSGIKEAFSGLFNDGGIFGGLVSGITGAIGLGGEGGGKGVGSIAGALGLGKIGSTIGGWLGIGGPAAGVTGAAGLAGTSGFVAGTGAGVGGVAATVAAGGTAPAAGGLGSLLGGGAMAGIGAAIAGIGAVIGLVSLLGSNSLPPVIAQLNEMHVTAQQISATGLTTEIQHVTSEMQMMVPALRNVAIASWDVNSATLTTRSAFDELQQSMSTGSGTIVEARYRYDELTGTWQASLGVIDSYRQEIYDTMLAANQAAGAMSNMGEATATAAHKIAGAADSISSLLDSARQTMVTAGNDGVSYHAAGFQVNSYTRLGGHVIGERGPEALLPLPESRAQGAGYAQGLRFRRLPGDDRCQQVPDRLRSAEAVRHVCGQEARRRGVRANPIAAEQKLSR
jgi:hypothetical protein